MLSVKRSCDGTLKEARVSLGKASASPFMPMFEVFREELDQHHDRRERIVKVSRDITASSKKMIFTLQKVRKLNSEIPFKIAAEAQESFSAILKLFASISLDLQGINAWRYHRQISPGIQEFIEAVSFQHYLRTQSLITKIHAQEFLPGRVVLTSDDFLLGLFDLVGELMRFAITAMATTGSIPGRNDSESTSERSILIDLRSLRAHFEALDMLSWSGQTLRKEVQKKMEVMAQSVEKVETAVYGMIIRGRERPKGWLPDLPDDNPPGIRSRSGLD